MSDPNSSPVSLPAGSYDYDALKAATNKAANGAAKNYDDNVRKALEESSENAFKPVDPRDTPGYEFKAIENETLGVTETIQVFNPKLAEEVAKADEDLPPVVPTTPVAAPADKSAPAPKE